MKLSRQERYPLILLLLFTLILLWSAIRPFAFWLWIAEISPILVGIALLIITYRRLPLSNLSYTWCFIGAAMMSIGAHYSFSEVPLFNQIASLTGGERNNYDKLGHVVQGVIAVLISQEWMHGKDIIRGRRWIHFFSFSIALSAAASYEIIEWLALLSGPDVGENFLGMQGYIWDAQSDMLLCALGGLVTIVFTWKLGRLSRSEGNKSFFPNKE